MESATSKRQSLRTARELPDLLTAFHEVGATLGAMMGDLTGSCGLGCWHKMPESRRQLLMALFAPLRWIHKHGRTACAREEFGTQA